MSAKRKPMAEEFSDYPWRAIGLPCTISVINGDELQTVFCTEDGREILVICGDGTVERGRHFHDDDAAAVAFVECLSKHMDCELRLQRYRAELAEHRADQTAAELAALKYAH